MPWWRRALVSIGLASLSTVFSFRDRRFQWHGSVAKYRGSGSFRSSHLFQAPRKIIFTFHILHKSFTLDVVKLAELSDNRFQLKKCHFRVIKTYSDPPTHFQGVKTGAEPPPQCLSLYCVHSLLCRYSVSDNVFYCEYIMACYITKNLRLSTLVNCLLVLFFF